MRFQPIDHRIDRDDAVRIAPAQTKLGRALLLHYGLNPDDPDTWLLVQEGRAYGSFEAVARLFPRLSRRYAFLKLLLFVPTFLQDWLYARIARNRYAVFGQADMCAMPDAALQAKLVR